MRPLGFDSADFPHTLRSHELIARYVAPRLRGDNEGRMVNKAGRETLTR
jgi:hypothetical protein